MGRATTRAGFADLVVTNADVRTLDAARPRAEAVAVRGARILAVGTWAQVRPLVGPRTQVVDAEGGAAVPAFHDAHLHLLSYARSASRLDCRDARSLTELGARLAAHVRALSDGAWVRAWGYDEARLREGRHPDRRDLDAAVPDRPLQLQHRSLHLDVLNTAALRALGLIERSAAEVERDPASGEPTGRLYHAADLLRDRLPRPTEEELAGAVRAASERLLAWGVTSVQDASHTNGPAEWALFGRLAATGALGMRLFFMPGAGPWGDDGLPLGADALTLTLSQGERGQDGRPAGDRRQDAFLGRERRQRRLPRLLVGPVKVMVDEATSEPTAVREAVAAARAAGRAVAIHAVSEAEVALALDALESAGGRGPGRADACRGIERGTRAAGRSFRSPDRIEHGAVIPDAWLADLRALGVTVVGQPTLVHERGDVYRAAYAPEQHGWLHRAGSLLRAGVGYAVGSDAPVTEPAPGLALHALQQRRTPDGSVLGADERLGPDEALAALTLGPARAGGAAGCLGRLRPGMLADLAVVDPEVLEGASPETARRPSRLTLMEGRVVWQRSAAAGRAH